MLIFEFENGSIVNLLTIESLLTNGQEYWMICQSGSKYSLTEGEFETIKAIFKEKLEENN